MLPIEIRDVSLVYDTPGGKVPGVKNVSFNIASSEFVCIVGPSGCGKSTLLNIIAGFLAPAAGEILIGGKKVDGDGMDRGVVFQDFAQLFPWRTALGHVSFGMEMKGVPQAERERIAHDYLALAKEANEHGWSGRGIDFDKLPTIPELITGRAQGRQSDREVTCFLNNIGLGYQFAAAGAVVYRKAKDSGLGHELPTDWFTEDVHP